jgi:hypothetical protein
MYHICCSSHTLVKSYVRQKAGYSHTFQVAVCFDPFDGWHREDLVGAFWSADRGSHSIAGAEGVY